MGDVAADGKPVILLVGVKLEHPLLASGHPSFKQEDVAKSVRQNLHAVQRYMDEHGYELTLLLMTPEEGPAPFEEMMRSKHFDAIVIGGGVKVYAECAGQLEFIVNHIKDRYGHAHIYFIAGPDQIISTVKRAAGIA